MWWRSFATTTSIRATRSSASVTSGFLFPFGRCSSPPISSEVFATGIRLALICSNISPASPGRMGRPDLHPRIEPGVGAKCSHGQTACHRYRCCHRDDVGHGLWGIPAGGTTRDTDEHDDVFSDLQALGDIDIDLEFDLDIDRLDNDVDAAIQLEPHGHDR